MTPTLEKVVAKAARRGSTMDMAARHYQIGALILRLARGEPGGFEAEVSQEIKRSMGDLGPSTRGGLFVPTAALNLGTDSEGGHATFERLSGGIQAARRARSVVAELGASIARQPDPMGIVRIKSGPVFDYVSVGGGEATDDQEPVFEGSRPEPKLAMISVPFSRELALTAGADMERLLEDDVDSAVAAAIDHAALVGSGADNQPAGLLVHPDLPTVSIGTDGGPVTWDHVTEMESLPAIADYEGTATGWAATPGLRKQLRRTAILGDAGAGPIWRRGDMLGHRAIASSVLPSDGTKGTGENLHTLIFGGSWSELFIAIHGVEILVDRFSQKKQHVISLTGFLYLSVAIRAVESFAAITDATVSA